MDAASVSPPGPQIDLMLFSYAGRGRGVSAPVISSAGVLRRQARERSQEVSGNIPNCETGALGGILQLRRVLKIKSDTLCSLNLSAPETSRPCFTKANGAFQNKAVLSE